MIHSFLHYRPGTNLETKKTSKKQKKKGGLGLLQRLVKQLLGQVSQVKPGTLLVFGQVTGGTGGQTA